MKKLIPLVVACILAIGCVGPDKYGACTWTCVGDGFEQSAESCEPVIRESPGCVTPEKRIPEEGEEIIAVGFDPEEDQHITVKLAGWVSKVDGEVFELTLESRQGFLGGGVYGRDGALLGIIQGDTEDGRMEGETVK
jgi:hypothetical protein